MNDKKKMASGLGILGAAVLLGASWILVGGSRPPRPEPELPKDGSRCVEPSESMIPDHPSILNEWRREVVREGTREYTSPSGERFVMSLTKTCLGCHRSRETFCGRCHDYASVHENCWDCHADRQEN